MERLKARIPYVLLVLVAVLTVPPQLRITWRTAETMLLPEHYSRQPFDLNPTDGTLRSLSKEALEAGLKDGDKLIAVEGRPVHGLTDLLAPLDRGRPGDTVRLRVERQGRPADVPLRLAARAPVDASLAIFPLIRDFAIPFFCIVLGFGVALIRPRDPMAWLLLGLMLCFSCMMDTQLNLRAASWEPVTRDVAVFVRSLLSLMWGPAMMVFGIYFPERLTWDRRFSWAKWLLIAPSAIIATLAGAYFVALIEDLETARLLEPVFTRLGAVPFWLLVSSTSLFFGAIWYKRSTTTGDARRRLLLLAWGTTAAMVPLLPIAVIANATGRSIREVAPLWVIGFAVAMLLLFPLTMAYVIVVQRALDLRVVVRQGVRYALAARAVRGAQMWITVGAILYAVRRTSDGDLRAPQVVTYVGLTVLVVALIRHAADWLKLWVDKRFFREAYSAEKILGELSDKVRTIVETRALLETVVSQVADSLHIGRVAVLLQEAGSYRVSHAVGFSARPDVAFAGDGGVVRHARTTVRPAHVYLDDENSWIRRETVSSDERATLAALETQLLVPLAFQNRLPGFLSLGPKLSDQPYSLSDVSLLQSVAGQVGLAIENSRLTAEVADEVASREMLRREVAIAREVQQRLFPQRLPEVAGISYAGTCRPASEVGGDYYDFLELPDGRFGLAIGDVSGKGIPAALLMASLQASLRGQAISGPKDLAELMGNVNRLLYDASPRSHFATIFYASYDPATRILSYVNAGHNAPMLVRRNGSGPEVIRLAEHGVGAGMTRQARYTAATVQLEPSDVLVGFTDGIAESMDTDGREWGEHSLAQALPSLAERPVPEILEEVLAAAETHAAGAPQHDDMTVLVMRVEPA